jgi:hypothetical protein
MNIITKIILQTLEKIFKVEFVRENDAVKATFDSNIKSAMARAKESFSDQGLKNIIEFMAEDESQFRTVLLKLRISIIEQFKKEPDIGDESFFTPYVNQLSHVC